ncbi:phosphotransferase family protein [Hypoxylon trugodes]|uniref:phosphotransferase family protein n=1 Tax=Hypoxylon trugodes TaxID=326681 RepID=UPI0021A101AE|nr:phosphotransferase family protein [Hypoxylon trugodes]KAI1389528.1 phosphotransferase family protein [Hypoxylon trugodes]
MFRCPEKLPAPIPTTAIIETASKTLPCIHEPRYRRTVVIGENFVVKYGIDIPENEGHALLSLEKYPSIPTPQLYAMYRENEKLYLIMELKPGIQLGEVWPSLNEDETRNIASQLREIWGQIRSIPSPGIFGNVTGGPLRHRFFQWLEPDPRITGPFFKEEDLNMALALRSHKNWEGTGRRAWMSEFFTRNLPGALTGHPSVFTHADLQRKNILVLEVPGSQPGPRQFKVTAVVDWEDAGWYPSYWEYTTCFVDFQWAANWPEHVELIIDPHISEAGILRLVRQDLEF